MKTSKSNLLIGALSVIAVVGLSGSAYFYKKVRTLEKPAEQGLSLQLVLADVNKVLVLPEEEVPTMATVADPSKLRDQPFFAQAEIGDIVLIFSQSKKAILWRPSTKQVVEVSALNTNSAPPQVQR